MPHLDASALESDPKGMALLREVIGMPTRTGSWIAAPKAHTRIPADHSSSPCQRAFESRSNTAPALDHELQSDWLCPRVCRCPLQLQKRAGTQPSFECGC